MIITGYIHASPLGMWTYLYFLSFITLAVTLALNVLTAIFMTAFTTAAKSNHMVPATKGGGALGQRYVSCERTDGCVCRRVCEQRGMWCQCARWWVVERG